MKRKIPRYEKERELTRWAGYTIAACLLLGSVVWIVWDHQRNLFPPPSPDATGASFYSEGKILVNVADAEILTALPGVGEALSQRIVDYRQEYGFFSGPEDLENVEGLGPDKVKQMEVYMDFRMPSETSSTKMPGIHSAPEYAPSPSAAPSLLERAMLPLREPAFTLAELYQRVGMEEIDPQDMQQWLGDGKSGGTK